MGVPRFAAERALSGRVIAALGPRGSDTPADRIADCVEECRTSGASLTECGKRCNPTFGSTYQCKMQDNSVNSTLCQLGVWAWEAACIVDCKLLIPDVPGLEPILGQVCTGVCHKLGDQMRLPCPPAMICV